MYKKKCRTEKVGELYCDCVTKIDDTIAVVKSVFLVKGMIFWILIQFRLLQSRRLVIFIAAT
jgi:hypothetical protein